MTESRSGQSENEFFEQPIVTVIDLKRYMTDPVFVQQTGLADNRMNDAYDLTLADGHHKCRAVLSCTFNNLIQKRMIRIGTIINLKKARMRYDETCLNGSPIPVVEDIEVVAEDTVENVNALANLPWHPHDQNCKSDSLPLTSTRAYYVDLWSSADVADTLDTVKVQVKSSLEEVTASDLYSLQEIAKNWRCLKQAKPHLLLRVMRRPRLVHYARPEKSDRWPFQLPLVVGDRTGCCVAVLWNVMASRYLQHVQEGRVLLLRNFTVKPRFQLPDHQVWHPVGLPWYDIDLNINAHHPRGELTLLDTSVLEDLEDIDLPLPPTNFMMRKQLSFVPDDIVCDVAGVITFLGVEQREKMKVKQGSDSGGFWIKRWVHIQDPSSIRPLIIQLYRGTQRAEFEEQMEVGSVLVCRHMRVVHGFSQLLSSRQTLHVYLSSTKDTQIYVQQKDENLQFPFVEDASLQSVLGWAKTRGFNGSERGKLSEICFSYPPLPVSLKAYTDISEHVEIIPSDAWKLFAENLSYREASRMVIQARLATVSFHRKTKVHSRSLRRKAVDGQENSQAHKSSNNLTVDDCEHLGYVHSIGAGGSSSTTNNRFGPDFASQDYFCLQWRGLNADIILDTFRLLHLSRYPPNLTLQSFLSGSHDAAPGDASVRVGEETVQRLLASAKKKDSQPVLHYLVVLDVYCVDGQTVVMSVNRAFPTR